MTTEIVDPYTGTYDAVCIELDINPEHTLARYMALVTAMEQELAAIGAPARADESQALKRTPLELIAEEIVPSGPTKRAASKHPRSARKPRRPPADRA